MFALTDPVSCGDQIPLGSVDGNKVDVISGTISSLDDTGFIRLLMLVELQISFQGLVFLPS